MLLIRDLHFLKMMMTGNNEMATEEKVDIFILIPDTSEYKEKHDRGNKSTKTCENQGLCI